MTTTAETDNRQLARANDICASMRRLAGAFRRATASLNQFFAEQARWRETELARLALRDIQRHKRHRRGNRRARGKVKAWARAAQVTVTVRDIWLEGNP